MPRKMASDQAKPSITVNTETPSVTVHFQHADKIDKHEGLLSAVLGRLKTLEDGNASKDKTIADLKEELEDKISSLRQRSDAKFDRVKEAHAKVVGRLTRLVKLQDLPEFNSSATASDRPASVSQAAKPSTSVETGISADPLQPSPAVNALSSAASQVTPWNSPLGTRATSGPPSVPSHSTVLTVAPLTQSTFTRKAPEFFKYIQAPITNLNCYHFTNETEAANPFHINSFQHIYCQNSYNEWSPDELRLANYKAGFEGPPVTPISPQAQQPSQTQPQGLGASTPHSVPDPQAQTISAVQASAHQPATQGPSVNPFSGLQGLYKREAEGVASPVPTKMQRTETSISDTPTAAAAAPTTSSIITTGSGVLGQSSSTSISTTSSGDPPSTSSTASGGLFGGVITSGSTAYNSSEPAFRFGDSAPTTNKTTAAASPPATPTTASRSQPFGGFGSAGYAAGSASPATAHSALKGPAASAPREAQSNRGGRHGRGGGGGFGRLGGQGNGV
jgi:hypothetical protein